MNRLNDATSTQHDTARPHHASHSTGRRPTAGVTLITTNSTSRKIESNHNRSVGLRVYDYVSTISLQNFTVMFAMWLGSKN